MPKTNSKTDTSVMPFEVDPPVSPKPLNPVEATYHEVTMQYELDRKAYRTKAIEMRWAEHESERREKFIRQWLRDEFFELENPYEGKSPKDVYRITLPYETRIDDLIAVGLWAEATKVWLYRHKCRATVEEIKSFLGGKGFPVEGDKTIEVKKPDPYIETGGPCYTAGRSKPPEPDLGGYDPLDDSGVHATGISNELRELLRECGFTVDRGEVRWVVGEETLERPTFHSRGKYREILASQDQKRYPKDQY